MKCEDYQEWIALYVDDALTIDEKRQLEAHLEHCLSCKETLETLIMMKSVMNEIEDAALPETFHRDLHKRLHKEATQSKKMIHKWMPYVSGLAAALLIGFVLVEGIDKDRPIPEAAPIAYSLEEQSIQQAPIASRLEEIPVESEPVADAPQVTSLEVQPRGMVQEEIWQVKCTDLEAAQQFLEDYAADHEVELVHWQVGNVDHYTLETSEGKETLKSGLENEKWLIGDIQITPHETPIIHLIISIQE